MINGYDQKSLGAESNSSVNSTLTLRNYPEC